jgi:hypothetical protein
MVVTRPETMKKYEDFEDTMGKAWNWRIQRFIEIEGCQAREIGLPTYVYQL